MDILNDQNNIARPGNLIHDANETLHRAGRSGAGEERRRA